MKKEVLYVVVTIPRYMRALPSRRGQRGLREQRQRSSPKPDLQVAQNPFRSRLVPVVHARVRSVLGQPSHDHCPLLLGQELGRLGPVGRHKVRENTDEKSGNS